jgi:DNA-binding NarL/FixJ family response regulator
VIRVLVVDDHAVVRTGLRHLIQTADDLEWVGEAADGDRALELVAELRPDVLLLDLSMPGSDGVTVIRRLRDDESPTRVLVLTSFSDAGLVLDAVTAGADGYLLKQTDAEQILDGVRTVASGGSPVDPAVARALLRDVRDRGGTAGPLTDRETEVLELIRLGHPNNSIARRLRISERTVKVHVTHIFQRIGVLDRTQAALWAERHLRPATGGQPPDEDYRRAAR